MFLITSTVFADGEQVTVNPDQWSSLIDAKGYQYVKYDDARKWLADYLGTSVYYVENNYSIAYIKSSQVLIMGTCQPDLDGIEYIYQFYYGQDLKLNVKKTGSNGYIEVLAGSDYTSVAQVLVDVSKAGSGVFDLGTLAMKFILSNALCFLFIGSSFCFTGVALMRKAMKTSRG